MLGTRVYTWIAAHGSSWHVLTFKCMPKSHQLAIKCHTTPKDLTKNPKSPEITTLSFSLLDTGFVLHIMVYTPPRLQQASQNICVSTSRQLPKQWHHKDTKLPVRLTVPVKNHWQSTQGEKCSALTLIVSSLGLSGCSLQETIPRPVSCWCKDIFKNCLLVRQTEL